MPQAAPKIHFAPGAIRGLFLFCVVSMFVAMFNYNWQGNGIHDTEGALLVLISTVLLVLASFGLLIGLFRGPVRVIVEILILLDFIGTALASYLLEAWILLALIAVAFIFWVIRLMRPTDRAVHS